jgi:hypothetical protein
VKCFRYDNPEYSRRYPAIELHLTHSRLPYFVDFRYIPQGIRVGGTWFPILKMKWIKGESLISFLEKNLNSPAVLQDMAVSWARLLCDLQKARIAHGDLQHGNVLVVGGELKLVDYDGMYVPALDGSRGLEVGHRNYQHPERTDMDFGPYLDNFSAWLIYISIWALSVRPSLWDALKSGDECLLFRKQDLIAPEQSEAFRLLRSVSDENVRDLVERFEEFLWLPPSRIPGITGRPLTPRQPKAGASPTRVSDWISDHVHEFHSNSSDPLPAGLEENEIGDSSWIQDHVEPPEQVGSFHNQVRVDRLFAVSAYVLACVLSAWKSPSDSLGTVALYLLDLVIATGSVVVFWLLRYFRDPIFAASRVAAIALREANRRVDAERTDHEKLKQKRQQRRDAHSAEMTKMKMRQSAAQADEAREVAYIDAELKNTLRQLRDKRRCLANDEANEKRQLSDTMTKLSQRISALSGQQQYELRQLDLSLGQRIRGLEGQLQQITSRLDSEIRQALKEYQDQIVLSHLHRRRIADAAIRGIGEELKRRMAQAGYISAADIATRRVDVPGIGAKKMTSLNIWIVGLDNAIRPREAPQALPSHKTADIERRYENSIQQLTQTLSNGRSQFAASAEQINKKYAEQKQILEAELSSEEIRVRHQTSLLETKFEAHRNELFKEEEQTRASGAKRTEECTTKFQVLAVEATAETERLRNSYASELENLNRDLGATSKCVREVRWRRDQLARNRATYAGFSFRYYCLRVLGRRG